MWTKKSILLVGTAILLALTSITLNSLQLLTTSSLILALLVVSIFSSRRVNITARRQLSNEKIFEEGEIEIKLEVLNKGKKTGFLELRDTIPKQLMIKDGSNYNFINLQKNEKMLLKYNVKCPLTGLYSIGPISLRPQDVCSNFYRRIDIDIKNPLSVYPRIEDLKGITFRSKSQKMYPGMMPIRAPGPGSEFFAIREYVPGDPFKDINWKAYGRTGQLLVNEHQREVVSDVTIILDARESSAVGIESKCPLKFGVRAAASLSSFFLKRRDSVGLVVYNDSVKTIKPGSGERTLYEILTALAGAQPQGNLLLKGVLEIFLPYIPPRTPILLISTLEGDPTIPEAISHIRALGFDVTILSPSSVEFELSGRKEKAEQLGKKLEIDQTPYDILKVERSVVISDVRGFGATVVDWKPNMSLMTALVESAMR